MAAGLEAELKADLLDGEFWVAQQIPRPFQEHPVVEARGGVLGGSEKEAGEAFLAAAQEPTEVLEAEVFLAAPTHEFIGPDKVTARQTRRRVGGGLGDVGAGPGAHGFHQQTCRQGFDHDLVPRSAGAQLRRNRPRAFVQRGIGHLAGEGGAFHAVHSRQVKVLGQPGQQPRLKGQADGLAAVSLTAQIAAGTFHSVVAHHRFPRPNGLRFPELGLEDLPRQAHHEGVLGMGVRLIKHIDRRTEMLHAHLSVPPGPEGAFRFVLGESLAGTLQVQTGNQ